eukprot:686593-Pelagomonas_calceolata.AAC.1
MNDAALHANSLTGAPSACCRPSRCNTGEEWAQGLRSGSFRTALVPGLAGRRMLDEVADMPQPTCILDE